MKYLNQVEFAVPIIGSITGNAATVTNGVYTTGTYNNPSWLTGLEWSKITGLPTDFLTHFDETLNTASPNGTITVSALTASGSANNMDFVIAPKGAGALICNIPNNATAAGLKRGIFATELQRVRSAGSQVASGAYSTIGGGEGNTGSGQHSVIGGGFANVSSGTQSCVSGGAQNTASGERCSIGGGIQNTASGVRATVPGGSACTASGNYSFATGQSSTASAERAIAMGDGCVASGDYSVALGAFADTKSRSGTLAYASGREVNSGDSQIIIGNYRNRTTDATPTVLTADSSTTASASNAYALAPGQFVVMRGQVVANRNLGSGTSRKAWEFTLVAYHNGSAVTVDAFTPSILFNSGVPWSISAAVTSNYFYLVATGEAGVNVQWTASMYATESWYQ